MGALKALHLLTELQEIYSPHHPRIMLRGPDSASSVHFSINTSTRGVQGLSGKLFYKHGIANRLSFFEKKDDDLPSTCIITFEKHETLNSPMPQCPRGTPLHA